MAKKSKLDNLLKEYIEIRKNDNLKEIEKLLKDKPKK